MTLKNTIKARYLRKTETKPEKLLWEKLRNNNLGIKFRRQHPAGNFVLDFYSPKLKLAVELDGSIHSTKNAKEYNQMRKEFLESKGILVLRFWNSEVENNLDEVIEKIIERISPSPVIWRRGRGEAAKQCIG